MRQAFALLAMILLAMPGTAREQPVSFSAGRMTLEQAIREIESRTSYSFVFDRSRFDLRRQVKFERLQGSLREYLPQLFGPQAGFLIRDRYIVVTPSSQQAKPLSNTASTGDIYSPTQPDRIDASPMPRPLIPPKDTILSVAHSHPLSAEKAPVAYSAYTSAMDYLAPAGSLPRFAVKTDLLYAGAMLTPNLSAEAGLTPHWTMELTAGYNPWNRDGSAESNDKWVHWIIRPEARYWPCERYDGHFWGIHAFYWQYNIGGHKVPGLFDKAYRHEGNAWGAGISYGYHLPLSRRWGAEFSVGAGYARLGYDRFDCRKCSHRTDRRHKNYFGPTRAGITLVFLFK